MIFVRVTQAYFGEDAKLCLVEGEELILLADMTLGEAFHKGLDIASMRPRRAAPRLPMDKARFAPLPGMAAKLFCIGVNYFAHAAECETTPCDYPVVFCKLNNTLAAHGQDICIPDAARQVDYEAELVVVMGKGGRAIPKDRARDHIFGYTCGNDLSDRDFQKRTGQWLMGKSVDQFGPVGPWIVTADQLDPGALGIACRVNGQLRQQSNTSLMMYDVDALVSYISQVITLCPGDMIFTGTPAGVIVGMPQDTRVWLDQGDVVEIEIEGIGTLRNRLVRA